MNTSVMAYTHSPGVDESSIMQAFAHTTRRVRSSPPSDEKGTLYPSQREAFIKLKSVRWGILNAPTGWGKSHVLCCLAAHHLRSDATCKVVICVPQRLIAKGFVTPRRFVLPDGSTYEWRVKQDYCNATVHKVKSLRKFLTSPAVGSMEERVVVTTHKGLSAAFHGLAKEESEVAVANTDFIFDEGHHVQSDEDGANQLGSILSLLLASPQAGIRAYLATAFFFRGDRLPIISDEQLRKFKRYTVPFDQYWGSLRHLESYRYDFVVYDSTIWNQLDGLLRSSQEPTIVYCPPEGHELLINTNKCQFVEEVVRRIERHYGAVMWSPETTASSGKVILDLVDVRHRAEKVEFAMKHGDQIAVVLTVGMFREGADWVQAQRVIDLIPSGSDQDRNQRFGRIIRDFPGKRSVSYYSFFRRVPDGLESERRSFSRLFTHFHASLVLENALIPIRVASGHSSRSVPNRERKNYLAEFDEQTQGRIIGECCEALVQLTTEEGRIEHGHALKAISHVLSKWSEESDLEPMAKQIVLMLRRRGNSALPVDDLVDAGFDKVWANDALTGIRLYSAGAGGPSTFAELRRAVHNVFEARWDETYEQLKALGVPPPSTSRIHWWVHYNRKCFRDGLLSPERVCRLQRIPWWTWLETYRSRFDRQYCALRSLGEPPVATDDLYPFVSAMRDRYRMGKLSDERIALLEAIPWWCWRTRNAFEQLVSEAAALPAEPKRATRLGQWVWRTKDRYDKGTLSSEETALCDTIPWWTWTSASESRWCENYESLAGLRDPPQFRERPKEYKFMHAQRAKRQAGIMPERHISRLNQISWWKW